MGHLTESGVSFAPQDRDCVAGAAGGASCSLCSILFTVAHLVVANNFLKRKYSIHTELEVGRLEFLF